jgi:signal transduction histidine kinase/ligand-binding sensor domain-containing protein/ActR/RegA family two-component response regulator
MRSNGALGAASFALSISIAFSPAAAAKAPVDHVDGFVVYTWSVQDGLPQSSVTDVAQDEAGFLWFGTFEGLVRFDGMRFEIHSARVNDALPSDEIDRVWMGPDGRLWIATLDGLAWWDGERFERGPDEIRGAVAHVVDPAGRVLVSTRATRIFAFEGLTPRELAVPGGCPDELVDTVTLATSGDGTVWAERCEALYRLDGNRWRRVLSRSDWPRGERRIHGLGPRVDGGLWIVTETKILSFDDGQLEVAFRRADRGSGNYVRVEDLGSDGLWTASLSDGAVRYAPSGIRRFDEENHLPHDAIRVVFRGREGHLWIGTDGGGLVQLRRAPVRTLGVEQGLGERIVRATVPGPDGRLYVATHGEGLWAFDGSSFEGPIRTRPELTAAWVWALHVDPDGRLWAGFLEDGASIVTPPTAVPLGRPSEVNAIDDALDGGVLVATSSGLFRVDGADVSLVLPFSETGTVTALRQSGDAVWFGTSEGRVFRKTRGGEWTRVSAGLQRASRERIRSIRIDPRGRAWIVAEHELRVQTTDGWQPIESRDGLGDLPPTDIAFDDLGGAWVASKRGIARFDRELLVEAARGGSPAPRALLNESDGLRSVEVNQVTTWTHEGSNLLVFSTLDGIALVEPARLRLPSVPPHVEVDFLQYHAESDRISPIGTRPHRTIARPRGPIDLPSTSDHLVIGLSAPSFADPATVRFDVRLDGPSGVYRGTTLDRTLTLHSPRPGRYRLEVRAETHHGKRSREPALLEYRIAPTLFETAWFVPSVAGAAVVVVLVFFGLRSAALRRAAERERGLRQSEQRYRALERKLLETQRLESLGLLAGGIAHDFNNLLTGILANAELLKDSTASSEEAEMVDGIVQAGRRAAELCEQMLAYSGRGRMVVETVDLNRVIEETIRLLRRSVGPDITFEKHLEPGVLAVDVDPARIRQVVMNLLTNASEALVGGRGTIRVSTMRRPGLSRRRLESAVSRPENPDQPFCCMDVVDEGVGMDRETIDRIFEPFFTTKTTGRGLGLAATLGIVQGHSGALFVESAPDRGSRFGLCLPASSSVPPPESKDDITPTSGLAVRRILVVDDEQAIRRTIQRTFRRMNFVVLEASTGPEALDLCRRMAGSFDLVFLDLTMPEMDGSEVLRRLRKVAPDVPVILMSGFARRDVLEKVGEESRVSFLQKPFGLHDLIRATNAAVPPALEDLIDQPL